MNKIAKYLIIIIFLSFVLTASAQSDEKTIRKGNRQYKRSHYTEAIAKYKEAFKMLTGKDFDM